MTTTIYFIRHAESDAAVRDDAARPLTPKGQEDSFALARTMRTCGVDRIYSSPYRRTVDTVKGLAAETGLEIRLMEDFRERRVGEWVEDFFCFAQKQWGNFHYKLDGGECLREVQERNLAALHDVLRECAGSSAAIGTHGIALGTLIHHYDPTFGWEGFCRIVNRMPYVLRMRFEGESFLGMDEIEWDRPLCEQALNNGEASL